MIRITNISKKFQGNSVVSDFSEHILENEMVAIMGPSGSGKTTLLNMIAGIEECDSGTVTINDNKNISNILKLRYDIALLFQNYGLIDQITVEDNLMIAMKFSQEKNKNEAIKAVLIEFNLYDKRKQKVFTLSGGEQQRIALARIMLKPHTIILADEPTGSLDAINKEFVMSQLIKFKKAGKTIVVVTHDQTVSAMCDRTITL